MVLQEYLRNAEEKQQMLTYAGKFNAVIRKNGAKPLLYGIWAFKNGASPGPEVISQIHEDVGKQLDIPVIPAGDSWQAVAQTNPEIELINHDLVHPGLNGSYLTACAFYACLTGKSPEGHAKPAVLIQEAPVDPVIARILQRRAWETVQKKNILNHPAFQMFRES